MCVNRGRCYRELSRASFSFFSTRLDSTRLDDCASASPLFSIERLRVARHFARSLHSVHRRNATSVSESSVRLNRRTHLHIDAYLRYLRVTYSKTCTGNSRLSVALSPIDCYRLAFRIFTIGWIFTIRWVLLSSHRHDATSRRAAPHGKIDYANDCEIAWRFGAIKRNKRNVVVINGR